MFHFRRGVLLAALIGLSMAFAMPAQSAPIELLQIGTWSTDPGSAVQDADLNLGGKYVIRSTYDDATATTSRDLGGITVHEIPLNTPGSSSFQIQIPMQGFDSGSSRFIYTQTEANHLPFFITNPVIQFNGATPSPANFVGYEFEGDFVAGATTNFVEIFSEVSSVDIGGGTIVTTLNQVGQVLRDEGGSFPTVIRSINTLVGAVPVIADAGPNLQYSAGQQNVTTNAGTTSDNNLGNARTDAEDFLTFTWTRGGNPLVGTPADGSHVNLIPGLPPSSRVTENVNLTVNIANSGLTNTTDTATWQVVVTEEITGLGGNADTLEVSYANALPIVNASATAQGNDLLFDLGFDDADLAVNALIPGFEDLDVQIFVDGLDETSFFASLIASGLQLVSHADLLAEFGAGLHTFDVHVADLVLALSAQFVSGTFDFTVNPQQAPVPEPASLLMLGVGLAAAGVIARRRRRPTSGD
jgi:hypothetical protein